MDEKSANVEDKCDTSTLDGGRRPNREGGGGDAEGDGDGDAKVPGKDASEGKRGDEKEDVAMYLKCQYSACRLARAKSDMCACTLCKNAWFCDTRCETLAVLEHKKRCDLSIKTVGPDPTVFKARLVLERVAAGLTHIDCKINWYQIYDIQQQFKNVVRITYRSVAGDVDISTDPTLLVAALNRAWVRLYYILGTSKDFMERDVVCPPEDVRVIIQFVQLERLPTLPPLPSPSVPPSFVSITSERPQVQLLIVRSVAPTSDPTAFVEDSFRSEATISL
jgi:hypothetical protein